MRIIIFNVEHGFCSLVLSPNRYALLIDCGRTDTFSPVEYILMEFGDIIEPYMNNGLAMLVISHPHDDHVEDIENVVNYFKPTLLSRPTGYRWSDLKEPGSKYPNLEKYIEFQSEYNTPAPFMPDWGCNVFTDVGLSVEEAKAIGSEDFVNNTSLPIIVELNKFKIVFPGDLMTQGWEELLKKEDFSQHLEGTTVFVASHHGHTSGFSELAYQYMGRPVLNIISAHKKDESVDPRYSNEVFASGWDVGGQKRRMLSTRKDGSIVIDVDGVGTLNVSCTNLDETGKRLVGF